MDGPDQLPGLGRARHRQCGGGHVRFPAFLPHGRRAVQPVGFPYPQSRSPRSEPAGDCLSGRPLLDLVREFRVLVPSLTRVSGGPPSRRARTASAAPCPSATRSCCPSTSTWRPVSAAGRACSSSMATTAALKNGLSGKRAGKRSSTRTNCPSALYTYSR